LGLCCHQDRFHADHINALAMASHAGSIFGWQELKSLADSRCLTRRLDLLSKLSAATFHQFATEEGIYRRHGFLLPFRYRGSAT
jgi:hypothetical protein